MKQNSKEKAERGEKNVVHLWRFCFEAKESKRKSKERRRGGEEANEGVGFFVVNEQRGEA